MSTVGLPLPRPERRNAVKPLRRIRMARRPRFLCQRPAPPGHPPSSEGIEPGRPHHVISAPLNVELARDGRRALVITPLEGDDAAAHKARVRESARRVTRV